MARAAPPKPEADEGAEEAEDECGEARVRREENRHRLREARSAIAWALAFLPFSFSVFVSAPTYILRLFNKFYKF